MIRRSTPLASRGPIALAAILLTGLTTANAQGPTPQQVEFFEKKVRPVLVKHCYSCHSAEAKKIKGGFRLDTRDALRAGGDSGAAIVAGDPAKSHLIQAVRHAEGVSAMPPEGKLAAAEIADLEAWVKSGAPDPRTGTSTARRLDPANARQFWSFRPVQRPTVPAIRDPKGAAWVQTEIDRFIFTKLEADHHTPPPPADKRTLIRRATYDLTGLPPTPEEIEAFLADNSSDAFEKLIDRLLASPAYGERWGRHWLDVVRYADTAGDNSDYPVPQLYRYRNWVIDAFNRDLPYDQFVRQQLAGDLIWRDESSRLKVGSSRGSASSSSTKPSSFGPLIATGYLASTKRFGSYEDARYPWYLTYEDTIDNLGKAFLGLTVGCARCHDHKFDPITQTDYYALYGFFSSTRYPRPGIELDKVQRDFVPLATVAQVAAFEKERKQKQAELDAHVKTVTAEKKIAEKALADAEKIANAEQRKAKVAELNRQVNQLKQKIKTVQRESETYARKPLPYETAYAVAEGKTEGKKKVGNACVQIKGDPERLGPEVPRRFLLALGGQVLPASAQGSGRRELANWITDPKNPLTARVMVNRIWQHHFGTGIVPTPNNFGAMGLPPTHPELLDYLAAQFVDSGWSVKAMHRLIMTSAAYRSAVPQRRLDAEAIRDTLLAVGGNLDHTPGGPHPFPAMNTWNFTQHYPFKAVYETNRRSVYLMAQRIQRHPFLALFDGADTNASTAARDTSTTPLQALFLMNDPFVHAQAKAFAARVLKERKDGPARIERAYLLLFGRPPTADEQAAATEYLATVRKKFPADASEQKAWESLARALFQTNEFVYVE